MFFYNILDFRNRLRLLFLIQGEINRRSNVSLTNIGHFLLTHFRLSADIVENIVDNLKNYAKMLTYSKAFDLKSGIFGLA